MRRLLLPFLLFACSLQAAPDTAVTAIASLIDPAKLATLKAHRAANPRLLKCIYWLANAQARDLDPVQVIAEAQAINHTSGVRAELVKASLLRNLKAGKKLGCLSSDDLDKLRRGRSPIVTLGPYAGEPVEVDHIVPIALMSALENEIANLEILPRTVNRRLGHRIEKRELYYAVKFLAAGIISSEDLLRIKNRLGKAIANPDWEPEEGRSATEVRPLTNGELKSN